MTIELKACEFASAHEAIQWSEAGVMGTAIRLDGKNLVADQEDIDDLAARGVEFAYLFDHEMPDGTHRIVTIPVND